MINTDTSFNRERIIALFLKENQLLLKVPPAKFAEHFYFEDPEVISTTPTNRNTKLGVTALASSEYFGRKTIRYNRIHLTDLIDLTVEKSGEETIYELLPKINTIHGTFFTDQDIEDEDITGEPDGDYTPDLIIKVTSLIFYDGPKIVLTP